MSLPEFETRSQPSFRVVIVCPFFDLAGNAGLPRMQRFVRWLESSGAAVTVISAGAMDAVVEHSWGRQIRVRDPLGLYPDPKPGGAAAASSRKENRLRRWLAYQFFSPDPSIVWSGLLSSKRNLLQTLGSVDLVLSSNPPESTHVGASKLANKLNAQFVMDMRDGWLDEPLRSLLRESGLRRFREARLERRCIAEASAIMVTSGRWLELLVERYPEAAAKTSVITNAYPPESLYSHQADESAESGCLLIHAGRFQGSDPRRSPEDLLVPLLAALHEFPRVDGSIELPGAHSDRDRQIVDGHREEFAECGWALRCEAPVPRRDLVTKLNSAQGLLLIVRSSAQIPAKLFEYLPTGLPVLAIVPKHSECWRICETLEQVSLVDVDDPLLDRSSLKQYLERAVSRRRFEYPEEFSESRVKDQFLAVLG